MKKSVLAALIAANALTLTSCGNDNTTDLNLGSYVDFLNPGINTITGAVQVLPDNYVSFDNDNLDNIDTVEQEAAFEYVNEDKKTILDNNTSKSELGSSKDASSIKVSRTVVNGFDYKNYIDEFMTTKVLDIVNQKAINMNASYYVRYIYTGIGIDSDRNKVWVSTSGSHNKLNGQSYVYGKDIIRLGIISNWSSIASSLSKDYAAKRSELETLCSKRLNSDSTKTIGEVTPAEIYSKDLTDKTSIRYKFFNSNNLYPVVMNSSCSFTGSNLRFNYKYKSVNIAKAANSYYIVTGSGADVVQASDAIAELLTEFSSSNFSWSAYQYADKLAPEYPVNEGKIKISELDSIFTNDPINRASMGSNIYNLDSFSMASGRVFYYESDTEKIAIMVYSPNLYDVGTKESKELRDAIKNSLNGLKLPTDTSGYDASQIINRE